MYVWSFGRRVQSESKRNVHHKVKKGWMSVICALSLSLPLCAVNYVLEVRKREVREETKRFSDDQNERERDFLCKEENTGAGEREREVSFFAFSLSSFLRSRAQILIDCTRCLWVHFYDFLSVYCMCICITETWRGGEWDREVEVESRQWGSNLFSDVRKETIHTRDHLLHLPLHEAARVSSQANFMLRRARYTHWLIGS